MNTLDPGRILFEDGHLIAVDKPAPLLTQAPPGVPSLESLVKEYIRTSRGKTGRVYLGVPHRLDRPVSGAIVFARNTRAARALQAQFEARTPKKMYWAIVDGTVGPDSGTWDDWLRKVPDQPRGEICDEATPGAKRASLEFRVLDRGEFGTRLELIPSTGRMHQLRIQAASRGFPIRGDRLYGSPHEFGPAPTDDRDGLIGLHARQLTIRHPLKDRELIFVAEPPGYWPASGDGDRSLPPEDVFHEVGGIDGPGVG